MKQGDVLVSDVLLTHPIKVTDRAGHDETLETVSGAAGFVLTNFSRERSADVDWKVAASALEQAAESDTTDKLMRQ